jgi:hypothetical protein
MGRRFAARGLVPFGSAQGTNPLAEPVLSAAEGPVLSGVEGLGLSGAEGRS